MKYQSFIMRVLCLLLIVGVVLGYNSMQKKDSDTEKDQQIASLTTRVEALEKQQDEILSALEEAAKAQEEAKKKAEEEAKNQKAQTEEAASGDAYRHSGGKCTRRRLCIPFPGTGRDQYHFGCPEYRC